MFFVTAAAVTCVIELALCHDNVIILFSAVTAVADTASVFAGGHAVQKARLTDEEEEVKYYSSTHTLIHAVQNCVYTLFQCITLYDYITASNSSNRMPSKTVSNLFIVALYSVSLGYVICFMPPSNTPPEHTCMVGTHPLHG